MKTSYLDYAMSVIVSRALPDVRDGLKPSPPNPLRCPEAGFVAGRAYRKSARLVGEVMGKYHPHGDASIYDALARMTQSLVDARPAGRRPGQFRIDGPGSAGGDALYRSAPGPVANFLLGDIDKDTVDFQPNYDATEREPQVLPARFPNILVNGAGGIAVGMATNIPPITLAK